MKKVSTVEQYRKFSSDANFYNLINLAIIIVFYCFGSHIKFFSIYCNASALFALTSTAVVSSAGPDRFVKEEGFLEKLQCTREEFQDKNLTYLMSAFVFYAVMLVCEYYISDTVFFKTCTRCGFIIITMIMNVKYSRFFNKVYPYT